MYSKTIEISKDQFTALDNLIDSDPGKYAQFSVSRNEKRGDAYKTPDGRTLFKIVTDYTLTIFVDADFKTVVTENPNHRFAKIHAIVPLFEETVVEAEPVVTEETKAAPKMTYTSINPITNPEAYRAQLEQQKRAALFQRHPRMKTVADLATAIGQQKREYKLYLALEIVKSAMWSHPQDEQSRGCYNELKDALAQTDAPLPELRADMAKFADAFGY